MRESVHDGMRRRWKLLPPMVVLVFVLLSPAGASASAPPANDDFDNATLIGSLPFTDSVDMSGATVASDDPTPSCAGPAGNGPGTVWYAYTPAVDTRVAYNAFGSSYEPGIVVYTGSRGTLTELLCSGGFGAPLLNARAGTTYYFFIQNFNGSLVFNASAQAAPPRNDDFDNATGVTSLPYTNTEDMSSSTLAPDDPVSTCGAGTRGTIWYSFTPTQSGTYEFDGLGSSPYEPGIDVWQGIRGTLTQLSYPCAGAFTQRMVDLQAGVTYYFEPENFDGIMQFNLRAVLPPTPPANISISVTPSGSTRSGVARIGGIATCSYATTANVSVNLAQSFSRFTASGTGSVTTLCSPAGVAWTITISSNTGIAFGPGRAQATASGTTCADLGCNTASTSKTLILRGS
jgi:hypothetical protein